MSSSGRYGAYVHDCIHVVMFCELAVMTLVRFARALCRSTPLVLILLRLLLRACCVAVDWIRCPHCRTETMCGSAGALKINFALVDLLHYDDAGLMSPAGAAAAGVAAAADGGTHCGNCGTNFVLVVAGDVWFVLFLVHEFV